MNMFHCIFWMQWAFQCVREWFWRQGRFICVAHLNSKAIQRALHNKSKKRYERNTKQYKKTEFKRILCRMKTLIDYEDFRCSGKTWFKRNELWSKKPHLWTQNQNTYISSFSNLHFLQTDIQTSYDRKLLGFCCFKGAYTLIKNMDNQSNTDTHTHTQLSEERGHVLGCSPETYAENTKELYNEGSVQPPWRVTVVKGSHWGRAVLFNIYTRVYTHGKHIHVHIQTHLVYSYSLRVCTCMCHQSVWMAVLWCRRWLWGVGAWSRKTGVRGPSLTHRWTALRDREWMNRKEGHKLKIGKKIYSKFID